MKKISFHELGEKLKIAVLRFTFPVFHVLGLAVLFFIQIGDAHAVISDSLWAYFGVAIPLSIAVTLWSEDFEKKILNPVLNLLSLIILLIISMNLPDKLLNAQVYQLVVVGLAFLLSLFFVPFIKKKSDAGFWEFSKTEIFQAIIAVIFASILMGGLSLAILSLKELFNVNITDKAYENLMVVCYVIFAPVYFLANIPFGIDKYKEEGDFNKFIKILGLYILLPIITLYIVILYVYLIQIIAKWELPDGWVSWLVSMMALSGFITMFVLSPMRQEKNKIVNMFSRFFPMVILPLLILMSIGIVRRFEDYGITINRAYVFLLNVWLYGVCIYLIIKKSRSLKPVLISFTIVAFFFSIGPWSTQNITKIYVLNGIERILSNQHYLKDGKVLSADSISHLQIEQEKGIKLASKIKYISKNYGVNSLQPLFRDDLHGYKSSDIYKRLNITAYQNYNFKTRYFNIRNQVKNSSVDISAFTFCLELNLRPSLSTVAFNDENFIVKYEPMQLKVFKTGDKMPFLVIPLKSVISTIDEKRNNNDHQLTTSDLTVEGENYKMIVTDLNAKKTGRSGNVQINQIKASLFLK